MNGAWLQPPMDPEKRIMHQYLGAETCTQWFAKNYMPLHNEHFRKRIAHDALRVVLVCIHNPSPNVHYAYLQHEMQKDTPLHYQAALMLGFLADKKWTGIKEHYLEIKSVLSMLQDVWNTMSTFEIRVLRWMTAYGRMYDPDYTHGDKTPMYTNTQTLDLHWSVFPDDPDFDTWVDVQMFPVIEDATTLQDIYAVIQTIHALTQDKHVEPLELNPAMHLS